MKHWVWNIGLAFVPVLLALALASGLRTGRFRWAWAPAGIVWLAFLPNTSYLITGWRHYLGIVDRYDLLAASRQEHQALISLLVLTGLAFIYVGLGVLSFTLALRPLECIARQRGVPLPILEAPLFFLVSHGVYLGLVARLNSWDLLTRPGAVFAESASALQHPLLLTLTAAFAIFLWVCHVLACVWLDGFRFRWEKWTAIKLRCSPVCRV